MIKVCLKVISKRIKYSQTETEKHLKRTMQGKL